MTRAWWRCATASRASASSSTTSGVPSTLSAQPALGAPTTVHTVQVSVATLADTTPPTFAGAMRSPAGSSWRSVSRPSSACWTSAIGTRRPSGDRVVATIAKNMGKTLVFCQTKRGCDRVEGALLDLGVRAAAIHGDLAQAARERALKRFTDGELAVLVATDVAARGIDIDDIAAVVHYEPAGDGKDYLHRSGRTARAGRDGWAVTLAEYNQHTQVRILQRSLRLHVAPPIEVFSNDARLADLHQFDNA